MIYVCKSREKMSINVNNLIAEIRKVKRIEKETALNKVNETVSFTKECYVIINITQITQMVYDR